MTKNGRLENSHSPVGDWRCTVRRSHGVCNTLNGFDNTSCGACGEDRPPAPDSLREIPPAAQRVGNDGVRLIRTGMPERVVLADIANAITKHGLTLDELRSLFTEDTKRLDKLAALLGEATHRGEVSLGWDDGKIAIWSGDEGEFEGCIGAGSDLRSAIDDFELEDEAPATPLSPEESAVDQRRCECGHYRSQHAAHALLDEWFACNAMDCDCEEFTPCAVVAPPEKTP